MPMNQARGAHGSFFVASGRRRITPAMKMGFDRVRPQFQRRFLTAGLATLFSLQIFGLCFCAPAAVDEHGCCPQTSHTEGGVNVASPSGTSCCPNSPGMRALPPITEPGVAKTQSLHLSAVHAWFVRSSVLLEPRPSGSASVGSASSVRRSPILRI